MIYLQVTRGVATRDHVFPDPPVRPSLVVTAKSVDPAKAASKAAVGIKVITTPDIRWKRPDIKSISLLPNVLAKQAARLRGAGEAWLIGEDGLVTEGSSSNAWIIDSERRVITHRVDQSILKGVTPHDAGVADCLARPRAGREELLARRGLRRVRGLHHRGDNAGHAGGRDRRPTGRGRQARPDHARVTPALPRRGTPLTMC